jgi:hypothetical protein
MSHRLVVVASSRHVVNRNCWRLEATTTRPCGLLYIHWANAQTDNLPVVGGRFLQLLWAVIMRLSNNPTKEFPP